VVNVSDDVVIPVVIKLGLPLSPWGPWGPGCINGCTHWELSPSSIYTNSEPILVLNHLYPLLIVTPVGDVSDIKYFKPLTSITIWLVDGFVKVTSLVPLYHFLLILPD
jgi:hypothetical protein